MFANILMIKFKTEEIQKALLNCLFNVNRTLIIKIAKK